MGKLTQRCNERIMKRLLEKALLASVLIIVVLSGFNCAYNDYYEGNWYDVEVPEELDYVIDFYEENDNSVDMVVNTIVKWVFDNLEYRIVNETRPVTDILNDGYGDCSSRALLSLALIYQITGVEGKLWKGHSDPKDTLTWHVFLEVNGNVRFRSTKYGFATFFQSYTFDEISENYMCFQ